MAKDMGCVSISRLYFRVPTLNLLSGLRPLLNKKDVLSMTKWFPTYKIIDVYVDKVKDVNVEKEAKHDSSENDEGNDDDDEDNMFNGGEF